MHHLSSYFACTWIERAYNYRGGRLSALVQRVRSSLEGGRLLCTRARWIPHFQSLYYFKAAGHYYTSHVSVPVRTRGRRGACADLAQGIGDRRQLTERETTTYVSVIYRPCPYMTPHKFYILHIEIECDLVRNTFEMGLHISLYVRAYCCETGPPTYNMIYI